MRIVFTSPGLLALTLGCALSVDVSRLDGADATPRSCLCDVRNSRGSVGPKETCEWIAQVRLRDSGLSIDCGTDTVRRAVEKATCEAGGDTAVLHRVSNPVMSCIQEDVDIYRWDPPAVDAPDGKRASNAREGSAPASRLGFQPARSPPRHTGN